MTSKCEPWYNQHQSPFLDVPPCLFGGVAKLSNLSIDGLQIGRNEEIWLGLDMYRMLRYEIASVLKLCNL